MAIIWINAFLPADARAYLEENAGPHRLLFEPDSAPNLGVGGASDLLPEAEIAFGQPDPDQIMAVKTLKWVHITSAGYTRYDREDLRQTLTNEGRWFTNSSSIFNEPCAQHVLAFMLAQARQLPASFEHQLTDHGWPTPKLRQNSRLLQDQEVLILGYGAIAKRLCELLSPFQLKITALRRKVRGDETVPTFPIDELAERVRTADHIVNILPANESTTRLCNEVFFGLIKPGAVFYNIGRGSTVDQEALAAALNSGQLAAALLDVTDPEPLPHDHFLWTTPNCVITPHTAGGSNDEFIRQVRHFLENLRRYDSGGPLVDRIF